MESWESFHSIDIRMLFDSFTAHVHSCIRAIFGRVFNLCVCVLSVIPIWVLLMNFPASIAGTHIVKKRMLRFRPPANCRMLLQINPMGFTHFNWVHDKYFRSTRRISHRDKQHKASTHRSTWKKCFCCERDALWQCQRKRRVRLRGQHIFWLFFFFRL